MAVDSLPVAIAFSRLRPGAISPEDALRAVGMVSPGPLGELPAILALNQTQQAVHIGTHALARFATHEVGCKMPMDLTEFDRSFLDGIPRDRVAFLLPAGGQHASPSP